MSNCCDNTFNCKILDEDIIETGVDNAIIEYPQKYEGVNTNDIIMHVDNENMTLSAEFTQQEKMNQLLTIVDDSDKWDAVTSGIDSEKVEQITTNKNDISNLSTNKQDVLVNQQNIKSVNGNSLLGPGNLQLSTYLPFPDTWTTNQTIIQLFQDIENDSSATKGMAYLGEVSCSDLPFVGNADVVIEIMDGTGTNKVIVATVNSGNVSPYYWRYTYWVIGSTVYTSGWQSFVPSERTIAGLPLSSNITKSSLQTAINLSNPNLLINGDFRVNQRGQASYTGGVFGVDHWKSGNNDFTVTKTTTGVTVTTTSNGWYRQDLDFEYSQFAGKNTTISCKVNGTIFSATALIPAEEPSAQTDLIYTTSLSSKNSKFRLTYISNRLVANFYIYANDTLSIEWAKLELGDTGTLFIPKPYSEELAACQMPAPENSGMSTIFSNPNLLINSDFSINQRGITSLTGTNQGYIVDRWRKGSVNSDVSFSGRSCTILINAGSLAMIVGQIIEAPNMVGKKITASINITNSNIVTAYGTNLDITFSQANGTYISGTNISLANKTGLVTLTATVPANTGRIRVAVMGTSNSLTNETITFDSPKLEIGEIATLFNSPIIAEELPKCMRYYQIRSNIYTIETKAGDRPIPMRVDGTVGTTTIDSTTYNYVDSEIY